MEAILVGADRLGSIPLLLAQHGISVRRHVSGRAASDQRKSVNVPEDVHVVIIFTDRLRHNVMRSYRDAAQRAGVRIVFCRHSACVLSQVLAPMRGDRPAHLCHLAGHGVIPDSTNSVR